MTVAAPEPLAEHRDLELVASGVESLDQWLKRRALKKLRKAKKALAGKRKGLKKSVKKARAAKKAMAGAKKSSKKVAKALKKAGASLCLPASLFGPHAGCINDEGVHQLPCKNSVTAKRRFH